MRVQRGVPADVQLAGVRRVQPGQCAGREVRRQDRKRRCRVVAARGGALLFSGGQRRGRALLGRRQGGVVRVFDFRKEELAGKGFFFKL